ncbi:MAG: hypothetical protein ACEY3B_04720 [Wolbachia sp.]
MLADEIPRMNRGMTVRGGMTVKQFVIPLLVSGIYAKGGTWITRNRHWNCKEFANISYYL